MLSQPATKIFLRTSEPHAAKWIAETLGDIEIERLRESRSSARGGQQSYGLERQVEPLVMPSEIAGLAPLRGFLKVGNLVVRLSFPFINLPRKAPALIERAARPSRRAEPPVEVRANDTTVIDPSTTDADAPRASQRRSAEHALEHFFG
jgi:hypothetical protein